MEAQEAVDFDDDTLLWENVDVSDFTEEWDWSRDKQFQQPSPYKTGTGFVEGKSWNRGISVEGLIEFPQHTRTEMRNQTTGFCCANDFECEVSALPSDTDVSRRKLTRGCGKAAPDGDKMSTFWELSQFPAHLINKNCTDTCTYAEAAGMSVNLSNNSSPSEKDTFLGTNSRISVTAKRRLNPPATVKETCGTCGNDNGQWPLVVGSQMIGDDFELNKKTDLVTCQGPVAWGHSSGSSLHLMKMKRAELPHPSKLRKRTAAEKRIRRPSFPKGGDIHNHLAQLKRKRTELGVNFEVSAEVMKPSRSLQSSPQSVVQIRDNGAVSHCSVTEVSKRWSNTLEKVYTSIQQSHNEAFTRAGEFAREVDTLGHEHLITAQQVDTKPDRPLYCDYNVELDRAETCRPPFVAQSLSSWIPHHDFLKEEREAARNNFPEE